MTRFRECFIGYGDRIAQIKCPLPFMWSFNILSSSLCSYVTQDLAFKSSCTYVGTAAVQVGKD